jgi:uncharacterized protein (TIGR02145 family)
MKILYTLAFVAVLASTFNSQAQDTYTEVCGVLSENTTWTKQNSPYYLKNCNLAVAASITLTIEAGVTVIIDPTRRLIVDGSLVVSGATNDSVIFRSSGAERFTEIYFRTGSTGHLTGFSLSGAVNGVRAEGAQISISKGTIRYCQTGVRLLNATAALSETTFKYNATGAIFANDSQTSGTISSCQFIGNTAGDYASAIYLGSGASFTITGSTFTANNATALEITDNQNKKVDSNTFDSNTNAVKVNSTKFTGNSVTRNKGFGLLATSSSVESNQINENDGHGVQGANGCTIVNNTINDNKGSGIQCAGFNTIEHNRISRNAADGIVEVGSGVIRYNTITANVGDGVKTSSLPTINHNNIYQNTGYNVNATKESNETINAKSNYWGTTVSAQIAAKIHDYYDDGMSVKVDYSDFASQEQLYPALTTPKVKDITLTSAVIVATLNPNSQETNVYVEWGLTSSYGTTSPTTPATLTGLDNQSVTLQLTDLEVGTIYHYRIKAVNASGTMYSEPQTFTTAFHYITDIRDGQRYRVVKIGTQWWTAENLRATKYLNNDPIPTGHSNSQWANLTAGAFAIYPYSQIEGLNSDAEVLERYGALYNWYTVSDSRGLCPMGWNVPSDAEWFQMENFVDPTINDPAQTGDRGTVAAIKLKSKNGWGEGGNGTDNFGFSALPGGYRSDSHGEFHYYYSLGFLWSSTSNKTETINESVAFNRRIQFDNSAAGISRGVNYLREGYSIRCISKGDMFFGLIIANEKNEPLTSLTIENNNESPTVYLYNQGGSDITITSITNSNPKFTTNLAPTTMAAGSIKPFKVYFNPISTETHYDTLTISSNDPLNPIVKLPLIFRPEYPSVQAKDITLDYISNVDAEITWNKGDGNRRVAFLRQGTGLLPSPASNKRYTANSIFGSGEQLNGWYCIYDGTGDRVGVTGLTATTSYQVVVYEYNGQAGSERYLTASATSNPLPFTTTNIPFVGVETINHYLSNGNMIWGDYNNDGLSDILVWGRFEVDNEQRVILYKNSGNSNFVKQFEKNVNVYSYGSVIATLADFDNDGFLDIIVSMIFDSKANSETFIYRNNGNETFTYLNLGLLGAGSSITLADYNNNGMLDMLVSGELIVDGSIGTTLLYKNQGNGTFTNLPNIDIRSLSHSKVAWGDYNNDGYPDILIKGVIPDNLDFFIAIYSNNGDGTFTEKIDTKLPKLYGGEVSWVDFNNDGHLDFIISGGEYNLDSDNIIVFKNNGNGSFTEVFKYSSFVIYSHALGDFDGDGFVDIIFTGLQSSDNHKTTLLRNNKDFSFSELSGTTLVGRTNGSISWGDFNNDNKLDFGFFGQDNYVYSVELYQNQTARTNTPPTAPTNLRAQAKANAVTLSWDRATDAQTPSPGLTYNLYFKRLSDGKVFGAPMSDLVTGRRRLAAAGNKWHATSATYHELEPGAYAWSVQAVDHSYAGGPFATEGTFIIVGPTAAYAMPTTGVSRTSATLNALVVTPDLETTVQFQYGTAPTDYASWTTVDATPSTVSGTEPTAVQASLSGLSPETTYYFRVKANNTEGTIYSEVKPFYTNDPPQVTTGSVTNVGPFSVILHGAVMPRNLQASVQFEYGETAALGSKVNASPAIVSGSSITSVQAEISALKANFSYYYRVSAESLSGIAYGATLQLTTAKAAPDVMLTPVGAITSTTAQVKALVVPHNLATTVSFEWGRKGEPYENWQRVTLPGTVIAEGEVSATLTLEPNTTYSYRARAESEAGWCETSDGEVKTLVKAPTVTTLGATSFTDGKATLTGLVTPHNSPTTVRVMYGLSPALTGDMVTIYYSQTLSGNSPIEVALETQPLQPQTQYYFCVMAINPGGTTYGDIEGFNTSAPLASVNPATEVTLTTARLSATVNGNGYDTRYFFRYGTDPQLTQFTATDELSLSVNNMLTPVNADLTGLEPNTRYYFRVVATNQYGESRSPIGDFHTLCGWEITSAKPAGVNALCQSSSPTTYTTSSATASTYQWMVTPSAAGYITGEGATGTMVWSSSFTGTASISVRGFSGVCASMDSEPLEVTVNPNPQPLAISGDNTVCPGSQGIIYAVAGSPASAYDWTATGGQVQHGKSTASAGVSWGLTSGLGSVAVTETVVSTGCSTTSTKPVTISGFPSPEKPSIRVKGVIRILVSSVNASAYQWYRDKVPIPEASKKFYVARQHHGSYAVEIGTGSCKTLSDLLPLTASAKGLEVEPLATVYPNPSRGQVSYEIAVEMEGLMLIRVLDSNGRQVYARKVHKPEFYHSEQLSIPNLQPGVYSIEAVMKGEVVDTQKIVIQ